MAIVQIPQEDASSGQKAQELKDQVGRFCQTGNCWTRTAAVGSLITGAVLLIQGKRRAGIAVTAAGAAFVLLEDPKEAQAIWNSLPGYLENGKRFLERFEDFVDEVSAQGDKLRRFLDKQQA